MIFQNRIICVGFIENLSGLFERNPIRKNQKYALPFLFFYFPYGVLFFSIFLSQENEIIYNKTRTSFPLNVSGVFCTHSFFMSCDLIVFKNHYMHQGFSFSIYPGLIRFRITFRLVHSTNKIVIFCKILLLLSCVSWKIKQCTYLNHVAISSQLSHFCRS
jgi:hypothetical protein